MARCLVPGPIGPVDSRHDLINVDLVYNASTMRSHSLLLRDRPFYRRLVSLALPIAAQNLSVTLLNFVDTIMIGRLGEESIAAVALGNQFFFLLLLFLFGIGSGGAVFMAQFWGKKDMVGFHKAMGLALVMSLVGSTLFMLVLRLFPALVLLPFQPSEAVNDLAVSYLRIVSLSYPATALTMILRSGLRSAERVRLPLVVSLIALTLNTVFNYLLIFGVGPFPELGVVGAAYATLGARVLEALITVIAVYLRKDPIAAKLREFLAFDLRFVVRYAKTAAPVLLNEIGWSVGITIYTVVFSRMGTDVLAAYNITETIGRLAFVIFIGTGNALAVMIGNRIGAGHRVLARVYATRAVYLAPAFGFVLGLVVFSLSGLVPLLFDVDVAVRESVRLMLSLFPILMIVKVFNLHMIVGILRAGGDTSFSLIVDVGVLWLVGVPVVVAAGLLLGLPVHFVYLLIGLEELIKGLISLFRMRSGRWLNDLSSAT